MIANPKYFFTCAAVMALVTYLVRMIPLVFMKRKIESRFIQSLSPEFFSNANLSL